MDKIQLGDKVRCKYTGFSGTVVSRLEFINGCIQFAVAPKWDKKAQSVEEQYIDSQSLEVIKPLKKKIEKKQTGGRNHKGIKMKGY